MRELRSTGPEKEIHLKGRKSRVRESRDDQVFNLLTLLVLMLVNLVIANPLIYIVSASFSSANTVMAGRVWLLPMDSFSKSLYSHVSVQSHYDRLSEFADLYRVRNGGLHGCGHPVRFLPVPEGLLWAKTSGFPGAVHHALQRGPDAQLFSGQQHPQRG